ncbi:hypothetical protein ANN_13799 [Periplaneta americana]|uniref:Uncharacterized protein n=1 Tax=Periplaneta americana TaxID=6978 RepID=A0ABQ8SUI9_PERAM|nr:hypothetical protein ANN_13799 [Periplaneta americana]
MSPGSSTESYPAFARIGLRENPGKNLNQVTCPDRDSNPGHLVSLDALTVTPQPIHLDYTNFNTVSLRNMYDENFHVLNFDSVICSLTLHNERTDTGNKRCQDQQRPVPKITENRSKHVNKNEVHLLHSHDYPKEILYTI